MAKKVEKGKVGKMDDKVTGGADMSRGFKSLGKWNPAGGTATGPTTDTAHKGYRPAGGGKAS